MDVKMEKKGVPNRLTTRVKRDATKNLQEINSDPNEEICKLMEKEERQNTCMAPLDKIQFFLQDLMPQAHTFGKFHLKGQFGFMFNFLILAPTFQRKYNQNNKTQKIKMSSEMTLNTICTKNL